MTKEEAKNKLRQAGYTVTNDNSVVTVIIGADGNLKSTIKAVKEKLKEIGYEASFSVRQQKDAENYSKEESVLESDTYPDDDEPDIDEAKIVTDAEESLLNKGPVPDIKDPSVKEDTNDNKEDKPDSNEGDDDTEYFDEEDSTMILGEDAIQFSLDDFGLDF